MQRKNGLWMDESLKKSLISNSSCMEKNANYARLWLLLSPPAQETDPTPKIQQHTWSRAAQLASWHLSPSTTVSTWGWWKPETLSSQRWVITCSSEQRVKLALRTVFETGLERICHLLQTSQQISSRAGIRTWVCLILRVRLCSLDPTLYRMWAQSCV